MKQHPIFASALALVLACVVSGCAESTPPAESAVAAEITRAAAVDTARRDAAARFSLVAPASVAVSRSGRYWVVDLRNADGAGLHYAIAGDGSIRERRVMQ